MQRITKHCFNKDKLNKYGKLRRDKFMSFYVRLQDAIKQFISTYKVQT